GERRARGAGKIVPIMGEEQDDPAADQHGAEHPEQSRGLLPATSLRFAVALSQSLRGVARERSVAHEPGKLLIKPGDVLLIAHESCGADRALREEWSPADRFNGELPPIRCSRQGRACGASHPCSGPQAGSDAKPGVGACVSERPKTSTM